VAQQYSEENPAKPKQVLELEDLNLNRQLANESKISVQVKIPVSGDPKCSRVETAEGHL